jgi:hypothetical protein
MFRRFLQAATVAVLLASQAFAVAPTNTVLFTTDLEDKEVGIDDVLAVREYIPIWIVGIGESNPTNLILYIQNDTTQTVAIINGFTAPAGETDVAAATLDLNTDELVAEFTGKKALYHKVFDIGIWDVVLERLLVNDRVYIQNNPYEAGMPEPTPVTNIYLTAIETAALISSELADYYTETETDTLLNEKLSLDGSDTMAGALKMGTNAITQAQYVEFSTRDEIEPWTPNRLLGLKYSYWNGMDWDSYLVPKDADTDGKIYGRQNGAWAEVVGGSTPDAEDVAFTPAGNIASTNVQAALEELDTEKVATDDATYTETVALAATAWQNPADATNWTWTSDGNEITLTGYTGPNDVVIPDMLDGLPVTGIGGVFGASEITSVSGGANILSIGAGEFYLCSSLDSIALPKVASVGEDAMNECTALAVVDLPLLTTVGATVFVRCAALTSIDLPLVTAVGYGAFAYCSNLASVVFSGNAPTAGAIIYENSALVTNYVTNPTATGWGATFGGRPVVRLPLYGDGENLTGIPASSVTATGTAETVQASLDALSSADTSADRTPYLIAYASTVTVSRANTDYQALASIGGPCTIIFEAGAINVGSTILFEIPAVGTNSVTLAAGPDYRYGDSLTGPSTTNTTYCLYQSPYNSTNRMVTLYRGQE